MKRLLAICMLTLVFGACNNEAGDSVKDEKPADSTSAIDTIIHQDTMTNYDGTRL